MIASWDAKRLHHSLASVLISVVIPFSLLSACTSSPNPARTQGKVFEKSEVITQADRIEIFRFDPERGRTWQCSFRRELAHGSVPERWLIEHAPDGAKFADALGDTGYINKLVDLLKTLQVSKVAGSAPLAELGLEPAQINLRFHRQGGNSIELKLGSPSEAGHFAYATLSSEPGQPVWEVQGAALEFLAYMESFQSLRERRLLSPLQNDDVDLVRLSRGSQTILEAEREGTHWKKISAKKTTPSAAGEFSDSVEARLENLLHLRIKSFVDEPTAADSLTHLLKPNSQSQPAYVAELTDRQDRKARLEVYRDTSGKLYAMSSLRPSAWFEIHPESDRPWSAAKQIPTAPLERETP